MASQSTEGNRVVLPPSLLWLADAPLFIDDKLVDRFYDAVVQPQNETMTTSLVISKETVTKLNGRFGIGGSVSPSDLLASLTTILPFLKVEAHAEAEGTAERGTTQGETRTVNLREIRTPQRQLVNLVLHYLVNQPDRLFLQDDPSDPTWRTPEAAKGVPRALLFLDLPGQDELRNDAHQRPEVRLIPTAGEFSNGNVELLYRLLTSRDGRQIPPHYTEPDEVKTPEELKSTRKEYWRWFDENFSATRAMQIIEDAARANGRIRWIDFRLPITPDGDTLHLHFNPAETYDTGSFAYQLVKRGNKHGLRLVGTLKSEPDMNVLAVYEK